MGTQFKSIDLALGATETTETDLGDIVVPAGASRITGISAAVALETGSAADGTVGTARLNFSGCGTLSGIPIDVVCMEELGGAYTAKMIECNISVKENIVVECFMVLTVAQAGTAHGQVCLRFE